MRLAERSAGRFLSTVEIRGEPAVKADVRGSAPHTGEAAARGASCFSHVPGHIVQIISHYGVSVIDRRERFWRSAAPLRSMWCIIRCIVVHELDAGTRMRGTVSD